jgi:hypothetical protein
MEQSNKQDELMQELSFMYKKYEELCIAYKKLAQQQSPEKIKTVHDMSHMSFTENNKEG